MGPHQETPGATALQGGGRKEEEEEKEEEERLLTGSLQSTGVSRVGLKGFNCGTPAG